MIKTILAAVGLTTIMFVILSFTTVFPIKTILTLMVWVGEDILMGPMLINTLLVIIFNYIIIRMIERNK